MLRRTRRLQTKLVGFDRGGLLKLMACLIDLVKLAVWRSPAGRVSPLRFNHRFQPGDAARHSGRHHRRGGRQNGTRLAWYRPVDAWLGPAKRAADGADAGGIGRREQPALAVRAAK